MGYQSILDYQLFSNTQTNFVYRAVQTVHAFAIDRMFIKAVILTDYRLNDTFQEMQCNSLVSYHNTIFKQVCSRRREHLTMVKKLPGRTVTQVSRTVNLIQPSQKIVHAEKHRIEDKK